MNKAQLARIRKESKDLVEQSSRMHVNCIRQNVNNSKIHENIKSDICYALDKKGIQFITEAEFKEGKGIADILILDKGMAIEIMHSEKDENIAKKKKKYPCPIASFRIGSISINKLIEELGL